MTKKERSKLITFLCKCEDMNTRSRLEKFSDEMLELIEKTMYVRYGLTLPGDPHQMNDKVKCF